MELDFGSSPAEAVPPKEAQTPAADSALAPVLEPRVVIAETDDFASATIKARPAPEEPKSEEKWPEHVVFISPTREEPETVLRDGEKSSGAAEPEPAEEIPHEAVEEPRARGNRTDSQTQPDFTPEFNPQPSTPRNKSMAQPPVSSFTKNIERQRSEQKSMTTLLSGVGLFLLILVLIFAGSAGFGFYVLYSQIKDQAVVVQQLDAKYAEQNRQLLQAHSQMADDLTAQNIVIKNQREEIVGLKTRLSETQNQLRREIAIDRAAIAELQRRIGPAPVR
ncbi:MAG: hypothetical protein SFY92_12715 [Verrucomicrobiae bacterium]|nr:hypothetical protein [Verrucomicrobiae bacterium]